MAELDPVTYQVLRHRLWSFNEEHGLAISRHLRVSDRDLQPRLQPLPFTSVPESSCSQGRNIQYLNAGASHAISWIIENYGADFVRAGDMFLTNDPWVGVSHQLDGLHPRSGTCRWLVDRLGLQRSPSVRPRRPTPREVSTPQAKNIFEESTPIPPVRIVEEGRLRPDIQEQMFLRRSRLPDLLALDLRAGIGGCNVAKAGRWETVTQFGVEVVVGAMERIIDDAEAAFVSRLRTIPDGHWCQDYIIEAVDNSLLSLTLHLTKQGDRLLFDNRDDPPQDAAQSMTSIGFRGAASAAVAIALCHDQLFAVGGAERHIDFDLRPGSVGSADFPAATQAARTSRRPSGRHRESCRREDAHLFDRRRGGRP